MEQAFIHERISLQLSKYWHLHKSEDFFIYLLNTFGTTPSQLPKFECIYIAQAEQGDPVEGWIGGLITRWWMVDNEGVRAIIKPELPIQPEAPENLTAGFYPRPVVKFFCSGTDITIGEAFSPFYTCRKTAELKLQQDGTVEFIRTHILWTSSSLGGKDYLSS